MRIVALINQNNPGGAQYAMVRLKRLLALHGHDVEIVFLRGVHGGLEPEGCRILVRDGEVAGRFSGLSRLYRLLRQRRPDAVIAFLPYACALGLTVAMLAGVRRRIASQRNPGWSYGFAMRWLDLIAGSIGIYRVNIGNSRDTLASFAGYPPSYRRRLRLVYNAIEGDFGASAEDIAVPQGVPLIVNAARLAAQKNQMVLIKALPAIPGAHLLLVGHGDAEADLKAAAAAGGVSERVHFLGNVSRPQIAMLLRKATVFAQPSLFEGQSNALLEAMVTGCAIVSSDIPTQVETLTLADGSLAGLVLPASAAEAWSTALSRMIAEPDLRAQLGALARRRAEDFSEAKMAEGFAAALQP